MNKFKFIIKHFSISLAFLYALDSLLYKASNFFQSLRPNSIRERKQFYNLLFKQNITIQKYNGILHFNYPIKGISNYIQLRDEGSDISIFLQIMYREEYKTVLELLSNQSHPLKIIDGGSNIGLTVLYFKAHFPNAVIACIEPFQENIIMLKENLSNNLNKADYYIYDKAIWYTNTILKKKSSFRDNLPWSFAVEAGKDDRQSYHTVTLKEVMLNSNFHTIDLLKLDIEGSEASLFENFDSFKDVLKKTQMVALEIHEELTKKETVIQSMSSLGFKCFSNGELLIAFRSE